MEINTNKINIPSQDKIWLKRSKRASVKLPDSRLNVYDYIYECNKNNLDDVALEYDPLIDYPSTKITYRELFKMIDIATKAYKKIGVKKGNIITVCLPSFVENIVTFYALNRLGAVPNQIHPLASKDEVKFYLEEAESKMFVSYDGNFDNFKDVVEDLDIEKVIMVDATNLMSIKNKLNILFKKYKELNKDNKISFINYIKKATKKKKYPSSRYISFKDFMKLGKHSNERIETVNNEVASLTHTSGTTGKSKGVLSSSYGFNEMVRQIAEETPVLERKDKELLVLPPYPLYVLCNNVHMCLARGINIVVVPKVDYQNIHKYFIKHKITAVQGIPSTVISMLNDKGFEENNVDLSTIKFIVAGGGALASETLNSLKAYVVVKNSPVNYQEVVTELNSRCREVLRDNSRPIEYVFVDNIPETKAGKKDFSLVQRFEEGKLEKKDKINVKARIKVKMR